MREGVLCGCWFARASGDIEQILAACCRRRRRRRRSSWGLIKPTVTNELEILAHRVAQIAEGVAAGDLTQDDAADFFGVVRNHAVEDTAMMTALVRGAAQKIVDAALGAAQTAINKLVGFALL
jgi:hypothetical protein